MHKGGTLGFCAKKYVHFVHFRFSALFLRLFLLNRLLFLVMRQIHVNESAQVNLCPWMYQVNLLPQTFFSRFKDVPQQLPEYYRKPSTMRASEQQFIARNQETASSRQIR